MAKHRSSDRSMGRGMGSGMGWTMGWGMSLFGLLAIVALVLAIAALLQYLG